MKVGLQVNIRMVIIHSHLRKLHLSEKVWKLHLSEKVWKLHLSEEMSEHKTGTSFDGTV